MDLCEKCKDENGSGILCSECDSKLNDAVGFPDYKRKKIVYSEIDFYNDAYYDVGKDLLLQIESAYKLEGGIRLSREEAISLLWRSIHEELSETQKQRLLMFYFMGMTQEEIANFYGVKQSAISFSLNSSIYKLRNWFRGFLYG